MRTVFIALALALVLAPSASARPRILASIVGSTLAVDRARYVTYETPDRHVEVRDDATGSTSRFALPAGCGPYASHWPASLLVCIRPDGTEPTEVLDLRTGRAVPPTTRIDLSSPLVDLHAIGTQWVSGYLY